MKLGYVHSLIDGIDYCRREKPEKVFIIGGGEIYHQAIGIADELIISHIKFEAEGEIYFPNIPSEDWDIVSRQDREKFEIVTYTRIHEQKQN